MLLVKPWSLFIKMVVFKFFLEQSLRDYHEFKKQLFCQILSISCFIIFFPVYLHLKYYFKHFLSNFPFSPSHPPEVLQEHRFLSVHYFYSGIQNSAQQISIIFKNYLLFRYNSHIIKFSILDCTIPCFLVYSQG